jgi:hypothetical protein
VEGSARLFQSHWNNQIACVVLLNLDWLKHGMGCVEHTASANTRNKVELSTDIDADKS